jgi:hypothetical protein
MPTNQKPLTTSDFKWAMVSQVRCGVSVMAVTEYFATNACKVVKMDLGEWSIQSDGERYAVVHRSGIPNGFNPERQLKTADCTTPVLVGIGNGRRFLIDGAHRVAKALVEKRMTILAVILTEVQTRACVRPGQMPRFERDTS